MLKMSIGTIVPGAAAKDMRIIKLDLKGSLDNNNVPEFDHIIHTLIKGGAKKIILDIDDLQYLDSSGIGSLIACTKIIRKGNGDIAVTRYTAQVLTILKPLNIEKFLKFFPTIEEGINYLKSVE